MCELCRQYRYYSDYGCYYYPLYPRNPTPRMAVAYVYGGPLRPEINGAVWFKPVSGGTEVYAEITGLPPFRPATNDGDPIGPHGFHIHEFGTCAISNPEEPFEAAGDHWNPHNEPHGNHAGDFPVLFSNDGYSRMSFFTNKFQVDDAIGKSVIIHENPDDYRSQPTGDAGRRLACGIIQWVENEDCCKK